MPRSLKEILHQADDLACRFEDHDPDPSEVKDAGALRAVRSAFQTRVDAEARLAGAVSVARAEGHSWTAIGAMLGTSGEAARQRYGQPAAIRTPTRTGQRQQGFPITTEAQPPQVPAAGGGKKDRASDRPQDEDGRWREKRSDIGKPHRKSVSSKTPREG
jgi:hypothetical protein